MVRQYGEAFDVLTRVRAESPERFAEQRYARDILSSIVAKRRTLTVEMREMTDAMNAHI